LPTTTYSVSGMTCSHCIAAVSEEIGKLVGVTGIEVDLIAGGESQVAVTSDAALAEADVRYAVDKAGYDVVGATG